VPLGYRSSLAVTGERQYIALEVQVEAVAAHQGLKRLNLCLVALVADFLQRLQEGSNGRKVLFCNSMDAQIDDTLAVGVIDFPICKRCIEKANPQFKTHGCRNT